MPARVVTGVEMRAPAPALPMSFSAMIPPIPSTAKPMMSHRTNRRGTGADPARSAAARSTGTRSTGARPVAKAALRSDADSGRGPLARCPAGGVVDPSGVGVTGSFGGASVLSIGPVLGHGPTCPWTVITAGALRRSGAGPLAPVFTVAAAHPSGILPSSRCGRRRRILGL